MVSWICLVTSVSGSLIGTTLFIGEQRSRLTELDQVGVFSVCCAVAISVGRIRICDYVCVMGATRTWLTSTMDAGVAYRIRCNARHLAAAASSVWSDIECGAAPQVLAGTAERPLSAYGRAYGLAGLFGTNPALRDLAGGSENANDHARNSLESGPERDRPLNLHTVEVTGSNPVSPTPEKWRVSACSFNRQRCVCGRWVRSRVRF